MMALDDFRRWLDVDARDGREGSVALEVTTDGRLSLVVANVATAESAARGDYQDMHANVSLDYSDAGMLLDWIREALGVLLARQGSPVAAAAVLGVRRAADTDWRIGAHDTPSSAESDPPSDVSGRV